MTNKGLEKAFNDEGIELVRSDVGDKYVLQKLNELNWTLGGEQSGHILCLDKSNTGAVSYTHLTLPTTPYV